MTNEEKTLYKMSDEIQTLKSALASAFNWLYDDTYQMVEGKKAAAAPELDITFLNDLRLMRAGYRLLKGLPEPDDAPQQRR